MGDTGAKTTLLLVSWGNNNGHITHCVALGRAAAAAGWRVVVASDDNPLHRSLIEESGFAYAPFPAYAKPDDWWLCWHDRRYLEAAVETDRAVIEGARADIVIHDLKMSTPIAASLAGVGCASICHQPLFTGFAYPGLGVSRLWLDGVEAFNHVLGRAGQAALSADLRELLARDLVLVPSVPEFDPPSPGYPVEKLRYVGPLTASLPCEDDPPGGWAGEPRDGVFLYRTVGTGASLPEFCSAFADLGKEVLVATGSPEATSDLRRRCAGTGFDVRDFWRLDQIRDRAAVAVHHGGPGTSLSCLEAGIPAVVLPGTHPDRCLYGERIQSLGLGVCLSAEASLDTSWPSAVDTTSEMPAWAAVRDEVERLRHDRDVRARVRTWQRALGALTDGTCAAAVDEVAALPSSRP